MNGFFQEGKLTKLAQVYLVKIVIGATLMNPLIEERDLDELLDYLRKLR